MFPSATSSSPPRPLSQSASSSSTSSDGKEPPSVERPAAESLSAKPLGKRHTQQGAERDLRGKRPRPAETEELREVQAKTDTKGPSASRTHASDTEALTEASAASAVSSSASPGWESAARTLLSKDHFFLQNIEAVSASMPVDKLVVDLLRRHARPDATSLPFTPLYRLREVLEDVAPPVDVFGVFAAAFKALRREPTVVMDAVAEDIGVLFNHLPRALLLDRFGNECLEPADRGTQTERDLLFYLLRPSADGENVDERIEVALDYARVCLPPLMARGEPESTLDEAMSAMDEAMSAILEDQHPDEEPVTEVPATAYKRLRERFQDLVRAERIHRTDGKSN